MKVRLATIQDLEVVSAMNSSLFRHDFEFDQYLIVNWPTGQEGQAYFKARIIDDDKVCFVIESGSDALGYLVGSIMNDSTRNGLVASLDNMFVQKESRRQGLGASLFAEFRAWAQAKNADRISVSAYSDNKRALGFYKSNGFRPLAETLEVEL